MPRPRTLVRDKLQPGSISGVTQLHRGDRRNASCAESQGGKPSLQQTPTTRFGRSWPAQNGPRIKSGAPFAQPLASSRALSVALDGLVAIARGLTPDPIPNSAVKTLCADGTAPQGAEE
jgi:hypothetical protein